MFSEREFALLTAIGDTIIPALALADDPHGFYARPASDLDIAKRVVGVLQSVAAPGDVSQLKIVLSLLDQPLVNSLWGGHFKGFLEMTLAERTALLQDWARSRISLRRKAFSTLQRLFGFLFYTVTDAEGCNPNWTAMRYPGGANNLPQTPKPITPLTISEAITLTTEVVIIGSGAGGGVVAGELSAAGVDVLVVEKGGYYAESDFDGRELRSQQRMYERSGFNVTADQGMLVLAGATLGGGTTINWTAALRTPDHVLAEWEQRYGVRGYTDSAYQTAMNTVSARIHVTTAESEANARNAVLLRGGAAGNHPAVPIPRNVDGCAEHGYDCGFCGFGCRHGAKRGTLTTYLQDAYDHGARIIVRAEIDRVLIENGCAVGVVGRARTGAGEIVPLTIRAKAVVAAGGALHTPALLLRSGLANSHIGRNLHLHPTSGTFGFYAEPIRGWEGVMMSHYIPAFGNLDGQGYGVALESAPAHPGLTAIAFPWVDGLQHKQLMLEYANAANILVITRDRDGGRVRLDREGKPRIEYRISAYDRAHLLRGLVASLAIHAEAGARYIRTPVAAAGMWSRERGDDLTTYTERFAAIGLRRYDFLQGSAHQMSSCRMGGNPTLGAVDSNGESFEVRRLFAADASALPTATGVNPMLTIMSVAKQISAAVRAGI
ncbi:MAG TPA: GMC family oxidoreductase N-terminal domain-containing protein [Aggregatilineales bacterium]|nr:GMC family oxidoreductase N-terminal domain-containing protein [Anaerolineales bacterium]HRE48272.1 GMC family oxidoreductase N-terminal domain-containing protein [Aggregatilineales bacterium]